METNGEHLIREKQKSTRNKYQLKEKEINVITVKHSLLKKCVFCRNVVFIFNIKQTSNMNKECYLIKEPTIVISS